MNKEFDRNVCREYLVKGNLRAALAYAGQFPDQTELCRKYRALFEEENYLAYDVEADLNEILLNYQKYYRDAFYLELPTEVAARTLRDRLAALLQADGDLDELESRAAEAFRAKGYFFLGGRTSGFYGPYIWRTEELRHYAVELPGGERDYAVKLLDGFIMLSWLDYISFGTLSTGGWSNGDGLIHCVKPKYDLESESFRVSLLKHEAQHASDQERYQGITSEDLEYRAKLVELIYSRERNLLPASPAKRTLPRPATATALPPSGS